MISLTINGQNLEAQEGSTVLQVAERAGIIIPTLCYHKDLSPYGGCRLCLVEVQGSRLPSTSCNLLVSKGMVVQTESPALTQSRRSVLEMLLRNFYAILILSHVNCFVKLSTRIDLYFLFYSTASNWLFVAPQMGQTQSSGISSKAVPGFMPPSGSPSSGS